MKYIPTLKYKERIDIKAYKGLSEDLQEGIVPLIEVFHPEKIKLEKMDENKKFFINLGYDLTFLEFVEVLEAIHKTHPNAIPVINSNHYFNSLSKKELIGAVKRLNALNFKELAVKINNIHNFYIQDQMELALIMLDKIESATFFLDVDYAYKIPSSDRLKNIFTNTIDRVRSMISEEIDKFVLCGSIVQIQSSNFLSYEDEENSDNDGANIVKNILYRAYCDLLEDNKNLELYYGDHKNLELYYSDYTIDEKNALLDDNIFIPTFYPVVKYTLKNGDIMVLKSSGKKDFDKYPEIAKKIINSGEYIGESHCGGCEYIKTIANGCGGGNSTGSPATWKLNMMTHHITTMAGLIK